MRTVDWSRPDPSLHITTNPGPESWLTWLTAPMARHSCIGLRLTSQPTTLLWWNWRGIVPNPQSSMIPPLHSARLNWLTQTLLGHNNHSYQLQLSITGCTFGWGSLDITVWCILVNCVLWAVRKRYDDNLILMIEYLKWILSCNDFSIISPGYTLHRGE